MGRWLLWKFDHFISWLYITRLYGPRCPDFGEYCPCCNAWQEHDDLFNEAASRPLPLQEPEK